MDVRWNGEWKGEGWYRIAFSDSGMDWTSDGPIWIDSEPDFDAEMESAYGTATETHLPYADYLGDGDSPVEDE